MGRILGVVAATFAALVLSTAIANADDEVIFLADLHANGFTHSGGAAAQVAQGRAICALLSTETEPLTIALDVQRKTHLDLRSSYLFVDIAASDLCPEYGKGIGMQDIS